MSKTQTNARRETAKTVAVPADLVAAAAISTALAAPVAPVETKPVETSSKLAAANARLRRAILGLSPKPEDVSEPATKPGVPIAKPAGKAARVLPNKKPTSAEAKSVKQARKGKSGKVAVTKAVEPVVKVVPAAKPTTVSTGTLAAWRAHRTMAKERLVGTTGKARKELLAKIAAYDSKIEAAGASQPAKAKASNGAAFQRASVPALKAHKTMLAKKLKGASRKLREELKEKMAEYDRKIAAASA